MRYVKDGNDKIFAFDDAQDELADDAVDQGMTEITVSEKNALLSPDITTVLQLKIEEINRDCKAEIEGGFISNALGSDHTYDSELEDQVNISGQVQLATDVIHKCKDVSDVIDYRSHTAAEMHQVGVDLASHKLTQLVKAKGFKDAAEAAAAANDLAALQAITWS